MTRMLTDSDDTTAGSGLARRTVLKGAATVAASALLASRADARDFGANAEPQRYPILTSLPSIPSASRRRSATPQSSGSIPAACGRKGQRGMRKGNIWSG